ncbi:ATP-binding protein [Burkholderia ubonensis]|uniref:ATP-binding protein n=1 Tax=Burkholderia ubonensis TaxID=101571 RepID=UPI0007548406|nr:ATP-binding protein [Burkholderia ubonensis]
MIQDDTVIQSFLPADIDHSAVLAEQMARLDRLLQTQVLRMQGRLDLPDNALQGLAASPDSLPIGLPAWAIGVPDAIVPSASPVAPESRLAQLIDRFALNDFERDVLLLCLLPLFDGRYSLMYAWLQENGNRKTLTIDTALNVLCPTLADKQYCQQFLQPSATLLRTHVLTPHVRANEPWSQTGLLADGYLYAWLCGHDGLPDALTSFARWWPAPEGPDPTPTFTAVLTKHCAPDGEHKPIVVLRGRDGSGRREVIARAAQCADRKVLYLALNTLPGAADEARKRIQLALREVRLRGGALILSDPGEVRRENDSGLVEWLGPVLRDAAVPVIVLGSLSAVPPWFDRLPQVILTLPTPDADQLAALLNTALMRYHTEPALQIAELVRRFRPPAHLLALVAQEADVYRQERAGDAISHSDLNRALRIRAQQRFGNLVQRIEPIRTLDDLIVGEEVRDQLYEILAAIRQREVTLSRGFARKIGYGTGISALFHGDSGTGKTMVAEVLAGELGVDLIKVDLSTVVNKYIGETEKNLSRIFDCAEVDAGVLFFDEADALFGKRTETKDAHDRHANIEVSYLLQRLERYPGLVVLTTNSRQNLDTAFNRRITFMVHFEFPDVALRERMWREIWPTGIAVAPDIDYVKLARRAEITGANIRNVALLASWLAADAGAVAINQTHIEHALSRELTKIGRIMHPA